MIFRLVASFVEVLPVFSGVSKNRSRHRDHRAGITRPLSEPQRRYVPVKANDHVMNVLVFSNWFPPIRSGSAFYASGLAQSLNNCGHDVTVVTLDWGTDQKPSGSHPFPIHLLPVIRVPKLPLFYNLRLMGFCFNPANVRRLQRVVRDRRIQIIHQVNHIFDSVFLTAKVASRETIPLVGSITTPIQHQSPLKQRLLTFADRWTVGKYGVRRWDSVVSLDQTVDEYVAHVYGTRDTDSVGRDPLRRSGRDAHAALQQAHPQHATVR